MFELLQVSRDFPAATWIQVQRLYMSDAKLEVELIAHLHNCMQLLSDSFGLLIVNNLDAVESSVNSTHRDDKAGTKCN